MAMDSSRRRRDCDRASIHMGPNHFYTHLTVIQVVVPLGLRHRLLKEIIRS